MANIAPSLNSLFERNQDIMLPEVLQRVSGRNVVTGLFETGTWPGSIGDQIDTLTVERSFADGSSEDGSDWSAVVTNIGTNDGSVAPAAANSLPPEQTLTTGQTRRQMKLFWKALESENINLELIRGSHELNTQFDITTQQFTQGVEWELEKRFVYAVMNTAGNLVNTSKVDNFATINRGSQGFPTANLPDSQLEQGFLDDVYDLMENETHGEGAIGNTDDGANVYWLLTEPLTSRGLKENNASVRQDINYAHMGDKMNSPLLQPYGMAGRSYGNFWHKIYKKMPRFDYISGTGLVRRPYWVKTAVSAQIAAATGITGGRGYSWAVNPLWLSAQYTTSFVINLKLFKWLVPGMIGTAGGGSSFETPNYFPKGIQWLNERNLDKNSTAYNPDKTIGHYRAVMAAAIQPLFPTYGWLILSKKFVPSAFTTYTGANPGT